MSLQPEPNARLQNPLNEPDGHRITLVASRFLASELQVRQIVSETIFELSAYQIEPDFQFSVEIVLSELLNNIVEHGYQGARDKYIGLDVAIIEDCICIKTIDDGIQMPGLKAPHPAAPQLNVDRDDLPEGQFGWFMIRKLCRALEYKRQDQQNHLTVFIAR